MVGDPQPMLPTDARAILVPGQPHKGTRNITKPFLVWDSFNH